MKRVSGLFGGDHSRKPATSPLAPTRSREPPPSPRPQDFAPSSHGAGSQVFNGLTPSQSHQSLGHLQSHHASYSSGGGSTSTLPRSGPSNPQTPNGQGQAGAGSRGASPTPHYFDIAIANTASSHLPPFAPRTPLPTTPNATAREMLSPPIPSQAPPQPGYASPQRTASPALSASNEERSIERAELHKTLKTLENVLVTLDEYRALHAQLAKVEKKLSKGCVELSKSKTVAALPSSALQLTATVLDNQQEVDTKYAKVVQKEYEALNESCAKYFRKVAKEERGHEDLVSGLEAKVKKAQANYEKTAKKGAHSSKTLEAHDKYIAAVSALTNEIGQAKSSHAASLGAKTHATNVLVASALGGIAESSFRAHCEAVRRTGSAVGPLATALNFCVNEAMPAIEPADLSEEELGRMGVLAVAEAQAEANRQAREQLEQHAKEQALAAWKAQQLGWVSPAQFAAISQHSGGNGQDDRASQLPRLDSNGEVVSNGDAEKGQDDAGEAAALKAGEPNGSDQANAQDFHEGGNDEGPSISDAPDEPPDPEPESADPVKTSEATSVREPASTLNRADTKGSLHSMAVVAQNWEESQRKQEDDASKSIAPIPTPKEPGSSPENPPAATNGRGEEAVPAEPAKAVKVEPDAPKPPPASSEPAAASNAPKGEAGGSAAKAQSDNRPEQSESTGSGRSPSCSSSSNGGSAMSSNASSSSSTVNFPRTPEEGEPLTRGVDVPPAVPEEPTGSKEARAMEQDPRSGPAPERLERRLSIWERDREIERQREREAELQRRVRETEERLRLVEKAHSSAVVRNHAPAREDSMGVPHYHSERPAYTQEQSYSTVPQSETAYERAAVYPGRFESRAADTYSRPGADVSRADTTASERSFVARMKARYQMEKEAEREAQLLAQERVRRERNDGDRAMANPGGYRRVTEIADKFAGRDYAAPGAGGRGDYPYAATTGQRRNFEPSFGRVSEFGTLPRAGPMETASELRPPPQRQGTTYASPVPSRPASHFRTAPAPSGSKFLSSSSRDNADEPAHSDICGCQKCSTRHYASSSSPHATRHAPPGRILREDHADSPGRLRYDEVRPPPQSRRHTYDDRAEEREYERYQPRGSGPGANDRGGLGGSRDAPRVSFNASGPQVIR